MTDKRFIKEEQDGSVLTITLDRPDVLNAVHRAMAKQLRAAFDSVEQRGVRCVLLMAEGRAFCAGQDLTEVDLKGDRENEIRSVIRESYNPLILTMRNLGVPIVCAVQGIAAGAGASIALACDIVVASTKASFVQAFCKVGLIPDGGGTYFLPRLVGLPRAAALALIGDTITAERAEQMGMIYKTVSPESLESEARALAKHLASQPTKALGLIKQALNASLTNSLEEQLKVEEDLQAKAGSSDDFLEGVNAFREKRAPQFSGK